MPTQEDEQEDFPEKNDEHEGVDMDLANDEQEISDEQQNHLATLQAVQDRAMVWEELRELFKDAGDGDSAGTAASASAISEPLQPPDGGNMEAVIPAEADQGDDVPMTLQQIVAKAMRKSDYAKCALGEAPGVYACLRRARLLMGPSRQFIRLVRLEENVLSHAILEDRAADLNAWNLREAELAAARRAANVCGQRLARASAWAAATIKLVKNVSENRADAKDGLSAVVDFKPLNDAAPQVLVFQRPGLDAKPRLAVTLTVFRGCITKQKGKEVVRTSKASATPLPATSTRRVHAVVLDERNDGDSTWACSCASPVFLLDPVNNILGELTAETKPTQTRLHVKLSNCSLNDLEKLASAEIPCINLEIPEDETAASAPAPSHCPAPQTLQFTDRSFSRAMLSVECAKFLRSLAELYESKGLGFVDSGYVLLPGKKKEAWSSLIERVPSYFLERLKTAKGYMFSKGVHLRLMEFLPSKGHWDQQQFALRDVIGAI